MGQLSCRCLLSDAVGGGVEFEVADVLVEAIEQRGVSLGIERLEGCFLGGFTTCREELVDSSSHSFSLGHLVDFAEAFHKTLPLDLDVAGVTELSTDPPQIRDEIVGLGGVAGVRLQSAADATCRNPEVVNGFVVGPTRARSAATSARNCSMR